MVFGYDHTFLMTSRAEALVTFSGKPREEALAVLTQKTGISFEVRSGSVRILALSDGAAMEAMTSAALAALQLIDAMKDGRAAIESVRPVEEEKPQRPFVSRGSLSKEGARPKPQTLMHEVAAPKPAPDNAREAFRNFMTAKRLRPTTWAKEAGVPSGEILGYLTGRSRGFSPATAEKLARAARVAVEDMFK
jgi:hypothetical protein